MSFRRVHGNYVNLGRLYSIPPWGTVPPYGLAGPQKNPVNLGNLYSNSQSKYPSGWAYFEDGSIFILPQGWCSHDTLEARMKILAHFVRSPTPKMQQIRATRTPMKRFVIIDKNGSGIRENMLRILARNAQDGQTVSVADPRFEKVELSLDPTGTRPVSARFSDALQLRYENRLRNSQALQTFRGTLVDGVLQPNVRLGNGLRLSDKPEILEPQITEKRRKQNREATKRSEGAGSSSETSAKSPRQANVSSAKKVARTERPNKAIPPPRKSFGDLEVEKREAQVAQRERELMRLQQQLLRALHAQSAQLYQGKRRNTVRQLTHEPPKIGAKAEPDPKIADIEARERALEQKEELLRYKRKTWLLEQKLAQATARSPPQRRFSNPKVDMQEREAGVYEERDGGVYQEPEPDHEAAQDSSYTDPNNEQLSGFSLHDTPPPEALENLRSRIRLPTRRMMRSSRKPGYR
ncbi:hypothetical protein yc1106_09727 [Curvularia clavata]|uniref:Uncharacterized protein n=1 Tax=Curvularia clavata TaxID=95742 RepID=A0A9Q8ZKP3_CURCL|nr:hypothetical protein yc1106_09727 [Curvularia clavata]